MNSWVFKTTWIFLLWFGTFTPSERIALGAAFLVLIGVVGEYIVEIPVVEERKLLCKRIKRLAMAILVLGLTGDILGIVMGQAEMAALTQEAGDAKQSAKIAHDEAEKARKEADSFEADIVSAKRQAADAESHLADAQQRAANAELELARIKTPRSLNLGQKERVAKALSQFERQPFALMVFSDGESTDFALEIDATLKAAQWERVSTPNGLGGDTAINIGGVMAPTVNVIGLRLWVGDDVSEAAAHALQQALGSPDINVPSGVGRSKWLKDRGLKLVVIEVGQKQI